MKDKTGSPFLIFYFSFLIFYRPPPAQAQAHAHPAQAQAQLLPPPPRLRPPPEPPEPLEDSINFAPSNKGASFGATDETTEPADILHPCCH